jgi:hypothetical protein
MSSSTLHFKLEPCMSAYVAVPSQTKMYHLRSEYRYIHLAVSPPCSEVLTLRKALQDALLPTFGISSWTYLDILWVSENGGDTIVRVKDGCVSYAHSFCSKPSIALILS